MCDTKLYLSLSVMMTLFIFTEIKSFACVLGSPDFLFLEMFLIFNYYVLRQTVF